MDPNRMSFGAKLTSTLNFIGGISGLLAIAAVLVVGGEIKKQVAITAEDVGYFKQHGTPLLKAHEDMDDERVRNLDRRMNSAEETIRQMADFKADLRGISAKLDGISYRLDRIDKGP